MTELTAGRDTTKLKHKKRHIRDLFQKKKDISEITPSCFNEFKASIFDDEVHGIITCDF